VGDLVSLVGKRRLPVRVLLQKGSLTQGGHGQSLLNFTMVPLADTMVGKQLATMEAQHQPGPRPLRHVKSTQLLLCGSN
jgi:hypothetical protein